MARTHTWETSLPAAECRARLEARSRPDSFWRGFRCDPSGTVYCLLRTDSFRLSAKGQPFVRNSFQPYFYGSMVEEAGKTLIRGRFRIHPSVVALMAVWFLGVATIGGSISVVMLKEILTGRVVSRGDMPETLGVLLGPAMVAFGVALVAFGWRMGRGQREVIERFLETTLQADQSEKSLP